MDALIMLIILLGWFGLGLWLAMSLAAGVLRRVRAGRARAAGLPAAVLTFFATFTIFWAIPFGDQAVAKRHFDALCKTEAGIKVLEKGDGTLGMRWKIGGGGVKFFNETGLTFLEKFESNLKYTRYTLAPDHPEGRTVEFDVEVPKSRYEYSINNFTDLGRGVTASDERVTDLQTGEILVRFRRLSYSGWIQRTFGAGINLYSAPCPDNWLSIGELVGPVFRSDQERQTK